MRIVGKLVTAFLLVAIIPIAVLGYLSYDSAKQALEDQAREDLMVIAEAKEGHLYSFLDSIKGRAIDFSSDGFIRDSVEAMQRLNPEDPRYAELQEKLNNHLKRNKMPLDKTVHMIAIIGLGGRIIAATEEGDLGRDESSDTYFIKGKEGPYVSDVHASPHVTAAKHPYHIAVSAPIRGRESNALLGVIVNYYDTREMNKMLSEEFQVERGAMPGVKEGGVPIDIYLVNKEKLLITPSRFSSDILNQVVESLPVRECAAGMETNAIYEDYHGKEVIGASMCVQSMGWTLIAEVETQEAFAPVAAIEKRLLTLGIASVLLAFFLAYFIAYGISSPVIVLSRVTRKIASGDFTVRAPAEGKDEIGELAEALNAMTAQLAESWKKERKLAAITEGSADAIIGLNIEGRIEEWNRGAERMFGYTKEEMLGRNFVEMLPGELVDEERTCFAEVVEEGFIENHESVRIHKDGSMIPVLITATLLKDEKGNPMGISEVIKNLSEIKRLQSAISKEKTRLESLIRGVREGVAFADANDNVVLLNRSAEKLFKIKSSDIIGKPIIDCHMERMDTFREVLGDFKSGKRDYHTSEVAYKGRDFEVTASPIKNGGEYLGTVMILRDITERKRAGEKLQASEEKYSTLVEKGNDGIVIIQDGLLKFVNSKMMEISGFTMEEVLGKPFLDFVAPEYRAEIARRYKKRLEGKEVRETYEMGILAKDGRTIPVEINASLIEYEGRGADMAIIRDITERKQAEKASAFLANITEHATDAIVGLDLDTNIVSWNRGAEMLFGYTAQEIIGKPWSTVVPKEAQEDCRKRFKKAIFKGYVKATETMRVAKGNKRFPAEMTITALKNAHGEHIGFVVITRDITERKQAEERLKKYAKELEHTNQLKDLFTDIMRHDLQNPVTVIKGLSTVLSEGGIPEELKEGLEKIRANAEKLAEMIESASKYAKLESIDELEFEERDLDEVLKEVIRGFQFQLGEKKIALKYKGIGKKPVMVNPMIEDAFVNLLSNAIKYSPEGSDVTIEVADDDGGWRIAVKDRGPGIPDSMKEGIFDRFTRIEKKGIKGTGLGLAIVKRIIELHKGRVWVEDNPGGGSMFCVRLPKGTKA